MFFSCSYCRGEPHVSRHGRRSRSPCLAWIVFGDDRDLGAGDRDALGRPGDKCDPVGRTRAGSGQRLLASPPSAAPENREKPMAEPGFVHLHVHSSYSLLEGALTIARLAELAKADHQPALALTDTDNMFGAL